MALTLREWLNEILGLDDVGRQEDPPEDVFVANVLSGQGNSLLFEGIWESNAAYVQGVIYAVTACLQEGHEWAGHCLRQSSALLRLSTAIARRSGLARNAIGGGTRLGRVQFPTRRFEELASRVRFTPDNLARAGIEPFDLLPFVFDARRSAALRHEAISWSSLEARPIVMDGEDLVVALPTALGAAIRRRAIEMALNNDAADVFEAHLTDHQFGNSVMGARGGLGLELISEPEMDSAPDFIGMICRFDVGAYAHVIFVQDRIDEVAAGGFRSIKDLSRDVRRLFTAGVAAIKAMPDFRIGMTILAFGGLGRGFLADPGPIGKDWMFAGLGYEDLELFADESNTSALQMYRLLAQERDLLTRRTRFENPNGFLNLYGFAKKNDFELLPEFVELRGSTMRLSTNYLTSVRTDIRRSLDHHGVPVVPRRCFAEVRRTSTQMFFTDLVGEPSYVSVADAMEGRPAAAIEVGGQVWWITVAERRQVSFGSLTYRVWDMARNWVVMIARHVAEAVKTLPAFIGIELSFPDGADLSPAQIADGSPLVRPTWRVGGQTIRIECPTDYLRAFGRADNVGDRWMIETITEGALSVAGAADATLVDQIAASVVPDAMSRHLHIFTPTTTGDFVLATAQLPRLRLMQPEVRAWADIGLAQRSGLAPGTAEVIEDSKEAGKILSKAVDVIWSEIRERLELIDRASVIERCIDNHNAIDRDRATWRHTAAAVLHLHAREDVMKAAVERESARSEVGLCCRVVVEMAVCTSPVTGGRICSLDDLDYLLARVSLLCGVASRNDEIHHGFAERIEIKPSGVFRFEDEFANRIHSPFMVALSRDQFDAAAEGYDTFYEVPEPIEDAEYEERSDPAFDAAFVAEYGVTPLRMIDFVARLGERAAESGNGRVSVRRSELKGDLVAMEDVDVVGAEKLLRSWCLGPRSQWDERRPVGAEAKDWYPWRFARRLSLLSRPIVQLTIEDDPLCLVSPVIAEHALEYALRSYNARLPDAYFRSKEMRSWVGSAIDRLGHAFNHRVAGRLRELGLEAGAEYLMTRLGGSAQDGDVDTLAWNRTSGEVFVIECKRLLADKTVGEIAERLVEFSPNHVESNGRRGPTRRHLDRVAILRIRLSQVAAVTGIAEGEIRIRSCLVTSALVPMQFQNEAEAYFDVVSDFDGMADHFIGKTLAASEG